MASLFGMTRAFAFRHLEDGVPLEFHGTPSDAATSCPIGEARSMGRLPCVVRRENPMPESFPANANRYKCPDCGRLVVVCEKPTLTVWHIAPECPQFAAFIQNLKPDKTRVGVVLTPDDWTNQ